jgi:nicotinamide riboside transporter PnuC
MRGDAAAAGGLVIGSMLLCAAVGYGLGSLAGLEALGGISGLFVGVFVGLGVVYARFRAL